MTIQNDLKCLLEEHRRKAYIVCEESCFCWEISAFLEKNQETPDILVKIKADLDDFNEKMTMQMQELASTFGIPKDFLEK